MMHWQAAAMVKPVLCQQMQASHIAALMLQSVCSSFLLIEPDLMAAISFEIDDPQKLLPAPTEATEPARSTAAAEAESGAPGEEQKAGFDGCEVHPSAGRLSVGDRVKVSCLGRFQCHWHLKACGHWFGV